ncbi:MAG: ABC transporter substrate-binding protein [bacterium]
MDQKEHLSVRQYISRALGTFSLIERVVFIIAIIICVTAICRIIYKINNHFLVTYPTQGGTLHEGIIGTPRYVNPLITVTDADKDISRLVYRGLMKEDTDGNLVPDLAQSYSVSSDNLTYTFTLKKAYFQDGVQITADDVLFTINSAVNPTLNSSEQVSWEGVSAKVIDPSTITFTLKQPYAPFLANTTLGILPKHVWQNISYDNWTYSTNNTTNVVGSGWYKISKISQTSSGIPQDYTLSAYRKNSDGAPRIDTIVMKFYTSEDTLIAAYNSGDIDTMGGIDPVDAAQLAKKGAIVLTTPLPRIFGLFFNQSQASFFADIKVRQAISIAINKDAIVKDVLLGYGQSIDSPIPQSIHLTDDVSDTHQTGDVTQAKKILEKDGWKLGADGIYTKVISKKETARLSFEIDTNNIPELKQSIDHIVADLKQVGIEAIPKVYETGSLNQDIIRPRKFQSLFFGQVVSNQADLFAFWDSSQRTSPGLNISGYANATVDKLLEQGKSILDTDKQNTMYQKFENEIASDIPAVFIYSPSYIYVVRPDISEGITLSHINRPEDRFFNENNWYLATDNVWKIFAK